MEKKPATRDKNRNHENYKTPNMEMSATHTVACSRKLTPTKANAQRKNIIKLYYKQYVTRLAKQGG